MQTSGKIVKLKKRFRGNNMRNAKLTIKQHQKVKILSANLDVHISVLIDALLEVGQKHMDEVKLRLEDRTKSGQRTAQLE